MTTTFLAPAVPAGVVAVIEVALTRVTLVAGDPPIVTVGPGRNPVPVIVTGVPPATGPDSGVIAVTVGAGDTRTERTATAEGTGGASVVETRQEQVAVPTKFALGV